MALQQGLQGQHGLALVYDGSRRSAHRGVHDRKLDVELDGDMLKAAHAREEHSAYVHVLAQRRRERPQQRGLPL